MLTGCVHKNTPGAAAFELPLTRSDIADYLGLTIETVSRQRPRLKTSNVIRLSTTRLIMVPNLDRLSDAAGQDNARH
jgi:CRP/FNR family transcriptional regulator